MQQRLEGAADLAQLQRTLDQTRARYQHIAAEVSRQRADAAPRLSDAVTTAMQALGMAGGVFAVQLEHLPEPAAHGLENTHFLVAAHAGSTPRAIDRIASGGELSRLALAIAVTTSTLGPAATLVFDEVDAGVGGAVAVEVGRRLARLAEHVQVIVVTHLAQVAAFADRQFVVTKADDGQVTTSGLVEVSGAQRAAELARMMGGLESTESALAHADELLAEGRRR